MIQKMVLYTESEKIVIASVMVNEELIDLLHFLEQEHFYNKDLGLFYASCKRLRAHGMPVDYASVYNESGRAAWSIEVPTECSGKSVPSHSAEHHAKIVVDGFIARQVNSYANSLISLYNDGASTDDLVSAAEIGIDSLSVPTTHDGMVHVGDAIKSASESIGRDDGASNIVKTGLQGLDGQFGGLHRGLMYVWAARPAMGKTAFATNIAMNMARTGFKVSMFSLEDTEHFMSLRILSRFSGINYKNLANGYVTEGDKSRVKEIAERIKDSDLWICDKTGLTVQKIRTMCIHQKRTNGLDAVFVDHLGELGRDDDAYSTVSEAGRGLRDLAKELHVPVVLLAQLNRNCESREDKRPMMSDIRDSGKIEQMARMVAFLYRDSVYNPDADPTKMEFICRKNTNGIACIVNIRCDLSTMSIF